ncbi:MAG: HAD-IIB family hydrolase [Oscillospiraceae bacterium]|nr:HAD-IIB family hydrolase [Oscillospiraceae bacterium]
MNLPYAGLALLTDLDGTLLLPDKTVSPEDAAAIADFRAKGGLFSIATGRGIQATQEYLDLFQPDFPAVMYNGALLYDCKTQQTAASSYLPAGVQPLLEELAAAFPEVGAEVLRQDGVFVFQDGEYERQHLEITHIPFVMKTLDEAQPERCFKALFAGAPEDISRMLEYVKQERFSLVNFTRSHRWFLEILPHHTNKGTALERLRPLLPAGTVIGATGDFDNDTAMLLAADVCGCPADSQSAVLEAVRAKGGFVSQRTCENGFFAEWIRSFIQLRELRA